MSTLCIWTMDELPPNDSRATRDWPTQLFLRNDKNSSKYLWLFLVYESYPPPNLNNVYKYKTMENERVIVSNIT